MLICVFFFIKILCLWIYQILGSIDDELTKLISNTTALQQKWIIRLILKEINLGLGKGKIFNCFHADASDLFDSSNSLSKVNA